MGKIVRTKTNAQGGITPEEKSRMDEYAKLWIERAKRTKPIEPEKIVPAIEGLYKAAGLKKPRVVIVPSPRVMAFAYGAAAAIWHNRKHPALGATDDVHKTNKAADSAPQTAIIETMCAISQTDDVANRVMRDANRKVMGIKSRKTTYDATEKVVSSATAATQKAVFCATYDAVISAAGMKTGIAAERATNDAVKRAADFAVSRAVGIATDRTLTATERALDITTSTETRMATVVEVDSAPPATRIDTRIATNAATERAADPATFDAVDGAAAACINMAGEFGIFCALRWEWVCQGGNMWPGLTSYLGACRDILGLELPEYENYRFWEDAAIHGGFRVLHEEFCMVSDFPEFIKVDDDNEPHCEDGPSQRWRDGWSLYHWHGTPVPAHWIEQKESLDPGEVLACENVEQRAAGIAIIGMTKMLDSLEHKILDSHPDPLLGDLIEIRVPGLPESELYLRFTCPHNGPMMEGVDKRALEEMSLRGAHAWHERLPLRIYSPAEQRT